jgi:CarD family transcriptional regulator
LKGGFSVYSIGDRVVYPMYGAGVIEAIEDKEIDGELMTYYVLRIPVGNLKIMVSTAKAERNGIRVVRSADEVRSIVKEAGTIEMSDNWNLRYKENMATLKTGDLFKIMEVFKTLTLKERGKSLSSIEKKLMGTAKQIILSEIILSQNVDKPEAENLLMEGIAISL